MKYKLTALAALVTALVAGTASAADNHGHAYMCIPNGNVVPYPVDVTEVKQELAAGHTYAHYIVGDTTAGMQRNAKNTGTLRCDLPRNVNGIPGNVLADNNGWLYPAAYADLQTIGYPAYYLTP